MKITVTGQAKQNIYLSVKKKKKKDKENLKYHKGVYILIYVNIQESFWMIHTQGLRGADKRRYSQQGGSGIIACVIFRRK